MNMILVMTLQFIVSIFRLFFLSTDNVKVKVFVHGDKPTDNCWIVSSARCTLLILYASNSTFAHSLYCTYFLLYIFNLILFYVLFMLNLFTFFLLLCLFCTKYTKTNSLFVCVNLLAINLILILKTIGCVLILLMSTNFNYHYALTAS